MTETPDEHPLRPDQEAAVRRLLGATGDAAPMPDDVAARLDATLADLAEERAEARDAATEVVDLTARRRRRLGAAVFVAAAIVVAAGIGISVAHQHDADDRVSAAASRAPDRSDSAAVPGPVTSTPSARRPRTSAAQDKTLAARRAAVPPRSGVPQLRPDHLRTDLLALRRGRPGGRAAGDGPQSLAAPRGFTCARGRYGQGVLLAVRYDGAPAVVAFRAPTDSTQVAEVLQCGTARVLGSVTLPPPAH